MSLVNEPARKEIIRANKRLLYKALRSLRSEGILRIWNGNYCKRQAREAVKKKGCAGGWVFHFDYEGVKRPNDIAIQFAGSNGIRQERWIALRILEALRSAGLSAEWQGDLKKKVLVDMSRPAPPVQKDEFSILKAARWLQSICKGGERNASSYLFHSKELRQMRQVP